MESLAEFEQLLRQTIGLNPESIGIGAIERAVQQRLAVCGASRPQVYLDQLRNDAVELQALIEAIVVSETWFFRHRETFTTLVDLIQRSRPAGTLRILSIPCSSGEEPYSIAMALLDAQLPSERFQIDAVDISAHVLALAQNGVYGKNSFRGDDISFRDRYFTEEQRDYRIVDAVRRCVHFRQGNIFAPFSASDRVPLYDAIFCRNLLIYFEPAMQERAIERMTELLKENAWLFVGPSETNLLLRTGFMSIKAEMTFAFFNTKAIIEPPPPVPTRVAPPAAPVPAPIPAPKAAIKIAPRPPSVAATETPRSEIDLGAAERLAGQGRFAEAIAICERHIQQHGPSAPAFHLLGLVHDAEGDNAQADFYYRKALYLDPNHHDALIHLAYLLDKQGDSAGARRLRERAQRKTSGKPETR